MVLWDVVAPPGATNKMAIASAWQVVKQMEDGSTVGEFPAWLDDRYRAVALQCLSMVPTERPDFAHVLHVIATVLQDAETVRRGERG